jgi:hypothetical protein
MYELLSFLIMFSFLGTAVYAFIRLEVRDEIARQPTQRMPIVRRKP